jgi:hypothetical protein
MVSVEVCVYERFTLPSIVTYDKTMPPLMVFLAIGLLGKFMEWGWFHEHETVYWSACGSYVVAIVWLEGLMLRIKRDAYDIYLMKFTDEELALIADRATDGLCVSMDTRSAAAELLLRRRA